MQNGVYFSSALSSPRKMRHFRLFLIKNHVFNKYTLCRHNGRGCTNYKTSIVLNILSVEKKRHHANIFADNFFAHILDCCIVVGLCMAEYKMSFFGETKERKKAYKAWWQTLLENVIWVVSSERRIHRKSYALVVMLIFRGSWRKSTVAFVWKKHTRKRRGFLGGLITLCFVERSIQVNLHAITYLPIFF